MFPRPKFLESDNTTVIRSQNGMQTFSSPEPSSSGRNFMSSIGLGDKKVENMEYTAISLNIKHAIMPLDSNTQNTILKGNIVFSRSTPHDMKMQRYKTLSLPLLNNALETAARMKKINSGERQIQYKRNRASSSSVYDANELTTDFDTFLNDWKLAGIVDLNEGDSNKTVGDKAGPYIMLSLAESYRIRVANLWPGCKTGDKVGIMLVEREFGYNSYVDLNGMERGQGTEGSFLQIIPVFNGTKSPVNCSNYYAPDMKDMSFWTQKSERQVKYEEVNGRIDFKKMSEESEIVTFNCLKQAKYWELGVIFSTTITPSESDVERALRFTTDYNRLVSNFSCELIVNPNPEYPYISNGVHV